MSLVVSERRLAHHPGEKHAKMLNRVTFNISGLGGLGVRGFWGCWASWG